MEPDANGQILDERYPARWVLNLIADKWTPIVVYCLAGGVHRFGEMQRRIPGLSKKMLIQVLRNLERDGLVHREVFQIVPPKTEYTLTDLGRRLHEPISLLCQWAADHVGMLEEIEQNRRASTSNSQRGRMRQCSTNRCRFGALALAEPAQKAPLPGEKQLQAKIKQLPAK